MPVFDTTITQYNIIMSIKARNVKEGCLFIEAMLLSRDLAPGQRYSAKV